MPNIKTFRMTKYIIFAAVLALIAIYFASCAKDYRTENEAIIQQYISDNNLTAIKAEDGLYYTMDVEGTGATPNLGSIITLHYRGYYTDGEQFDATTGSPATFQLADLITGWKYGLQHFKKGGKGKLLVPSHLGYGSTPPSGIRSNAVLVFDIDLVGVQ